MRINSFLGYAIISAILGIFLNLLFLEFNLKKIAGSIIFSMIFGVIVFQWKLDIKKAREVAEEEKAAKDIIKKFRKATENENPTNCNKIWIKKINKCRSCGGTGKVRCPKCHGTGYLRNNDTCDVCGSIFSINFGWSGEVQCDSCNGTGKWE